MPFKPGEFTGRKSDSKRVAVVELFTGAYCPPCVAADIAFDAALEVFKPSDVILLQYHTHIPLPDRLTNPATEERLKFYEKEVRGVPTAFVNGKTVKGLGGAKDNGRASYDSLRDLIEEGLEAPATVSLKLHAKLVGEKLEITGDVSDLKKPGENVKLRFVLIEEVVRYPGGNGQRLHHHVVRDMPGGAEGFALKDEKSKQNALVDLAELKKSSTNTWLTSTRTTKGSGSSWMTSIPLDLKRLKVVALLQDDDTKEILQAAQVDVPEGK